MTAGEEQPVQVRCPQCGQPLIESRCAACQVEAESRFVHRELMVLLVLTAAVVIGLFVTRAVAHANHRLKLKDAAVWSAAAERDLADGRSESAITALHRAATIDPHNRQYRLALAVALVALHHDSAARQVLVGMRQTLPEDSEVNLLLARLEAREGNTAGAIQGYQSALYGTWAADEDGRRRQARVEFVRYLLAQGEQSRALSELLILSGNLPDRLPFQIETGELFRDAGDPRRALDHFRRALRLAPDDRRALAGAGEAAFELGEYAAARAHLRAADPDRSTPQSARLAELRDIADFVLERDPLRPQLSFRNRWDRLRLATSRARERLAACFGSPSLEPQRRRDLESLGARIAALEAAHRRRSRERAIEPIEMGLSLVYQIERQTAGCAAASPLDRALLLVGDRYDIDRR